LLTDIAPRVRLQAAIARARAGICWLPKPWSLRHPVDGFFAKRCVCAPQGQGPTQLSLGDSGSGLGRWP
jgi:hypothetical protein